MKLLAQAIQQLTNTCVSSHFNICFSQHLVGWSYPHSAEMKHTRQLDRNISMCRCYPPAYPRSDTQATKHTLMIHTRAGAHSLSFSRRNWVCSFISTGHLLMSIAAHSLLSYIFLTNTYTVPYMHVSTRTRTLKHMHMHATYAHTARSPNLTKTHTHYNSKRARTHKWQFKWLKGWNLGIGMIPMLQCITGRKSGVRI